MALPLSDNDPELRWTRRLIAFSCCLVVSILLALCTVIISVLLPSFRFNAHITWLSVNTTIFLTNVTLFLSIGYLLGFGQYFRRLYYAMKFRTGWRIGVLGSCVLSVFLGYYFSMIVFLAVFFVGYIFMILAFLISYTPFNSAIRKRGYDILGRDIPILPVHSSTDL